MLRNRKLIVFVVFVMLFVAVLPALAQDVPPIDTSAWPSLDQVLGGQLNEFLRTLDPVKTAPITIAAIALLKWLAAKAGWGEKISGSAISGIVIAVIYFGYVGLNALGQGETFTQGAPIVAIALDGALKVLVLLFGQQVLYNGAKVMSLPLVSYEKTPGRPIGKAA